MVIESQVHLIYAYKTKYYLDYPFIFKYHVKVFQNERKREGRVSTSFHVI